MSSPGILYVTMQPKPGLPHAQFHDWYNNEHGPSRLRLPHIFSNGLRYRATDGAEPEFLAVYDVTSMSELETKTYTSLRTNRSPREASTISQVDVGRRFFDLVACREKDGFRPVEMMSDAEAEGLVTVAMEIEVKDTAGAGEMYRKWFEEEHVGLLAKVPGWLRSRLFRTSTLQDDQRMVYLALHDYTPDNGLGGSEQTAASMDTPWRTKVFNDCVASKTRRIYSLIYVFAPAPQDLSSLSNLTPLEAFTSPDTKTTTTPGPDAVIASYITTPDSLCIPYRLEGNPSPTAPTLAFCNSLLTNHHMWDPFIAILKRNRPDLRLLRYDTRGRHAISQPPKSATLTTLTNDLVTLLDTLRIPKLHALIGVSMGGATTLHFALKHPTRLSSFIACDFNCTSTEANTSSWKDRIATAQRNNGAGITTLADATVSRWFHPSTLQKPHVVKWMTDMVAANNVEGFANSCTALWDYDLKSGLEACKVPGLLVVGEADGKGALVKTMEGFRGLVGGEGVRLEIVPDAGHLPMCEAPQAFWEAVQEFL